MSYTDGQAGGPVHLSLPLPELNRLAADARGRPSEEVRSKIIALAGAQAAKGRVDLYWLHGEVLRHFKDVPIGQVALVLLAWDRVSR